MEKIRITGIGVVNRAGISSDEFWKNLQEGNHFQGEAFPVEFRPNVPASKLRRVNRYCKLAVYASDMAWKEAVKSEREINEFARGTIFTTGYGPMEAQVKFCREVAKGQPDLCSPAVFTGTVPNACIGTVCICLKCKGVSTMLMGGNQIEYSSLLLQNKQAELILSGAVEEYSSELYKGIQEEVVAEDVTLAEGCVVFAMEQTDEMIGYCTVEHTKTISLPCFPLLRKIEPTECKQTIISLLKEFQGQEPDAIFSSASGIYFDTIEQEVLEEVFSKTLIVNKVKQFTGETMGCGFSMNIMVAALCLKYGYIPSALTETKDVFVSKILVCGYDVAGNYMCALLVR